MLAKAGPIISRRKTVDEKKATPKSILKNRRHSVKSPRLASPIPNVSRAQSNNSQDSNENLVHDALVNIPQASCSYGTQQVDAPTSFPSTSREDVLDDLNVANANDANDEDKENDLPSTDDSQHTLENIGSIEPSEIGGKVATTAIKTVPKLRRIIFVRKPPVTQEIMANRSQMPSSSLSSLNANNGPELVQKNETNMNQSDANQNQPMMSREPPASPELVVNRSPIQKTYGSLYAKKIPKLIPVNEINMDRSNQNPNQAEPVIVSKGTAARIVQYYAQLKDQK